MSNSEHRETIQPKSNKIGLVLINLVVVIAIVFTFLLTSQTPERTGVGAMKGVIYSAIEKNPDIIDQLLNSPADARKQIQAIVLAKPDIQSQLKSHNLWQQRDDLFSIAWDEIVDEFQEPAQ